MRCSACGTDNVTAARFCEECGAPLAGACPRCGNEVGPAAKFCRDCGAPLVEAPTSVAMASRPDAPGASIPRHLAEKILATRTALEDERKQLTVLFADVKGSTELIRDLDTEAAQALLDGAVRVMMDAVHRFEGTVSRLQGDGLMALFGAPIAHEDHAVRACYAALALQDAMRRYAEEVRRAHGVEVEARVGLHSGEVIVRLVSDDLHMDYTAMGQTVHLAARMEQLAAGGSIRVTAETLALVEGYVEVRSIGAVPVKGLPEPIEVFEVLGAGAIRTRLQASAGRGLTRFVGRQVELEAVHAALGRAAAGHGQVVALVGEPGVGKSRLIWEATHSHRTRDWTILESGSVSYGKATSYLPVVDLLRAYCRIAARDDVRAVREKLVGKLLALDEALRTDLPPLLALLDAPVEEPAWDALDPSQRRRRTIDALRRVLLRESRVRPLLLVFEDLHWVDAESQAVLDALVDGLPAARLLLLVNYRPEYRHAWGSRTYYTQLALDPLPAADAGELLAALLGSDPALEPLKRLLVERTEGNPFFLEESVRTLVEAGALGGAPGEYRPTTDPPSVALPATVQAVLAARVDRLAVEDKRLLQTASVIGKDVPLAVLRAVAALPEDDLRAGLTRLQASEFLYEATLFPEVEYTFKHALTHEAAYAGLLQERRRALHGRVVEAIEAAYAGRLAEHVERLAEHALRGEAWEKAATYCREAAERAIPRSGFREAAAHYEQALAALARLPETDATRRLGLDLRFHVRGVLTQVNMYKRSFEIMQEAETIATTLGDDLYFGRATAYASSAALMAGDPRRAIERGREAIQHGEALDDPTTRVVATVISGWAHLQLGQVGAGVEHLRACLNLLDQHSPRERFGMGGYVAVEARAYLCQALALRGDFDAAVEVGQDAVQIADDIGQPWSLAMSLAGLAFVYLQRGDEDRPHPLLERAWSVVPKTGNTGIITARLGLALARAGRPADAFVWLDRAIRTLTTWQGPPFYRAMLAVDGSEAYLLAGRPDAATDHADAAVVVARSNRLQGLEARALRLLGEIALQVPGADPEPAEQHFREALTLAVELGMRLLQGHCHLGLGKLHRRYGRTEEARTELSAAVELYRAMDMTHWLPNAEAELAALSRAVPAPAPAPGAPPALG